MHFDEITGLLLLSTTGTHVHAWGSYGYMYWNISRGPPVSAHTTHTTLQTLRNSVMPKYLTCSECHQEVEVPRGVHRSRDVNAPVRPLTRGTAA